MQHFMAYKAISVQLSRLVAVPDKTTHNLLVLASLKDGWMRGHGKGISDAVFSAACDITSKIQGYRPKVIEHFPDLNGGLLVSGIFDCYVIDILCRSDGCYDCSFEQDGVSDPDREKLTHEDVLIFLQEKTCHPQNLYSYSTRVSTVRNSADTKAWRSKTPPAAGFPYLSQNAQLLHQEVFANI